MSMNILKVVADAMTKAGLNYEFGQWTSDIIYPYWVGEYAESEPMNEDGMQEVSFILTGFTRGSYYQLEDEREKIRRAFPICGGRIVTVDDGSVVAIFYGSAFNNLPTGDAELKKMQVSLIVKEWSVT